MWKFVDLHIILSRRSHSKWLKVVYTSLPPTFAKAKATTLVVRKRTTAVGGKPPLDRGGVASATEG